MFIRSWRPLWEDDAPPGSETAGEIGTDASDAVETAESAVDEAAEHVGTAATATAEAAADTTNDAAAAMFRELSTALGAVQQGLGEVKDTLAGLIGAQSHEKAPAAAESGEGATVADVEAPAPPAPPQTHARRRAFKRGR